ncbi:hypothetical protein Tco_0807406 [Tanacetum coccineum]
MLGVGQCSERFGVELFVGEGTYKSRITRKQSKNEQARTRESEEYKKAKARKVKPQSTSKWQGEISQIKALSIPLSSSCHVAMEEAQVYMGFCTKSFGKEAQVSLKRIATLAIRVRSLIDPTPKIFDPMIGK